MEIKEINPTLVIAEVEKGAVFIDVREPYEIEEISYDIPGHLQIALGDIQARMNEIPKDKPVIIGCRSGARSMNACQFLAMQGYDKVSNLEGGIMKWANSGCPTK